MASKNIRGITIEIDGATTGLEKSLQDVNKKARDIQSELKEVERLLKLDPKNTELVAQKQKLLGDAVENTKEKLERLKSAQKQVDEQFKNGEITEEQYRGIQREIIATEENLKSLQEEIKNTNNKWKDTAASIGDFGKKTEELGNKLAPVSKAAAGALTGLVGIAVGAGAAADDINTLSKQTGLSVEEIQKFKMASDTIDVSMDTLAGSLSKLTKNMGGAKDGTGPAAEGFKQLGVSILDSNGNLRDNEDVFYESIDALGKMTNETERDALAMQLFGKSAQDLNPLILGGADALREMGAAAEAKGLIMSQEELDKANEMQDTLDSIKAESMQGLMKLGAELGPILIPVFQAIGDAISGLINWFSSLDEGTMKTIMVVLGVVAAVAPVLIVIGKIASGISAVMTLVSSLGPVLAVLTGPVGLVIAAIAAAVAIGVVLYKNWDKIKQFAANLGASLKTAFTNIKTSIVAAWNGVITGIKTVWANVVGFIKGLPGQMLGFGKNIIQGLINGILGSIGNIGGAVKKIGSSLLGGVKKVFGIHSPAEETRILGEYTGEGFVVGIENMAKRVGQAAATLNGAVVENATTQTVKGGIDMGGTLNINITGEGAGQLNRDPGFVEKVKAAILNDITKNNRTIPNRMSLIPVG
jgi:phage-related minor tail protein